MSLRRDERQHGTDRRKPTELTARELGKRGIRCSGNGPTLVQEKSFGRVALLAVEGEASADLVVTARITHPQHVAIVFLTAKGVQRRPWREVRNRYHLIAPPGAILKMRCWGRWKMTRVLVPAAELASSGRVLPGEPQKYTDRRLLDHAMERLTEGLFREGSKTTPDNASAVEQVLIDMGDAVLLDRLASKALRPRDDLRNRAIAVIRQQGADPLFTPSRLAQSVNASLRQLQVAFADADTTIAKEIRRQRTRRARSLLTSQRFAALSIDEIAVHAGFGTTMSLRRSLLETYGATPTGIRREHADLTDVDGTWRSCRRESAS